MNIFKIRDLVTKITEKALEKSFSTKADVFVNFQSHTKQLGLSVYLTGWKSRIAADYYEEIYLEPIFDGHITEEEILEKLQKAYDLIYSI